MARELLVSEVADWEPSLSGETNDDVVLCCSDGRTGAGNAAAFIAGTLLVDGGTIAPAFGCWLSTIDEGSTSDPDGAASLPVLCAALAPD